MAFAAGVLALVWAGLGGCNQILSNPAPDSSGGTSSGGMGGGGPSGGQGGASTGGAGAGLGGMGGEVPPPATLDGDCSRSGDRACDANDEKLTLICSQRLWVSSGSCSASENCDPATGVCTDIVPECAERQEDERYCTPNDELVACGPNLVSTVLIEACAGRCHQSEASAQCVPATCGDGKLQEPEGCDDGNDDNTDSCTEICEAPFCGDGFEQTGESCDHGSETDGCDDDCTPPECGDQNTNEAADEDCDDGNEDNTDSCTNVCEDPECGDGHRQAGEDCDTAGESESCDGDCTSAACGDSNTNASFFVDPYHSSDPTATEQCDPKTGTTSNPQRAASSGNDCDSDCTEVRCGDGFANVPAGEDCDATYHANGGPEDLSTCDSDCTAAACGDGYVNTQFVIRSLHNDQMTFTGEECDPNTGTTVDTQRAVSDGVGCERDCTAVRCGDGYVNAAAGETCEEGFVPPGLAKPTTPDCDGDCTAPECGDGFENQHPPWSETCDDGNTESGDGCSSTCKDE